MKILVTGGAGFIGSHLCEELLGGGPQVRCYDNFLTGSRANVEHLSVNDSFTLIEGDVCEPLPGDRYDFIFHMASPASPVDYAELPIETLLINSSGCKNVLDLARESGARVFMASTSEIYGDPEVSPQGEDYWGHVNPIGPRSCYDEGKRFGEALAVAYQRRYGMDICLGRLFNTFGPRMRVNDGRAVPNFINQALRGDSITVYGDGSQTRSFCYVDDLVRALLLVLEKAPRGLFVVNLGNDAEMSVLQLAEKIKEVCRSDSEIIFKALPDDDPTQRRPRLDRARDVLGYEPRVSLRDGLANVAEWFSRHVEVGSRQ